MLKAYFLGIILVRVQVVTDIHLSEKYLSSSVCHKTVLVFKSIKVIKIDKALLSKKIRLS